MPVRMTMYLSSPRRTAGVNIYLGGSTSMNYYDVVRDLKGLVGVPLQSIKPGSNITILGITESAIIIKSASNAVVRRSLTEVKRIVEKLLIGLPVHVETVLAGSGSSRNQPETVMANLPYIEWLKIKNKKHIIWVKKVTHPMGTVKEMDAVSANIVKTQYINYLAQPDAASAMIAVFTSDLAAAIEFYSKVLGLNPTYQGAGCAVYRVQTVLVIVRYQMEGLSITAAPVLMVNDINQYIAELSLNAEPITVIELPTVGALPMQILVTGRFGDAVVISEFFHLEV